MEEGLVIKSTGSWYTVVIREGEIVNARLRGKLRMKGIRTTNPVAVGDWVKVVFERGSWSICGIKERRNYIIRRSANLSKEAHVVAANLDVAVLIATLAHPVTSTVFIDRFLASVEAYGIPAVLIFNKVDLYDEAERERLEDYTELYGRIGYKVLHTSVVTGEGIDEMKEVLKNGITVLSGISGVGKSSLINAVEPGLSLKTAIISEAYDTGKHTTTFAEMFRLSFGGFIVDTPGLRSFGNFDMKRAEISHYFPEMFKVSDNCRFHNCVHVDEPGCAVLEAVGKGEIAESRYMSYLNMLEEEATGSKYR